MWLGDLHNMCATSFVYIYISCHYNKDICIVCTSGSKQHINITLKLMKVNKRKRSYRQYGKENEWLLNGTCDHNKFHQSTHFLLNNTIIQQTLKGK